jgi:hypothetical protein
LASFLGKPPFDLTLIPFDRSETAGKALTQPVNH